MILGRFPSAKQTAEFYGLEPRTVQRWVKSELQKGKVRAIVMRSDSDGGVSMRYSALAANGNKEWILKNFNLKDHSDENVVSIIGSFSPKVFQLKKLALGWALTAARFTGKENDSLNFGISTLWL